MFYYIETEHGVLVEILHHERLVMPVLREMNARGAIPKRVYTLDSKGRKVYKK